MFRTCPPRMPEAHALPEILCTSLRTSLCTSLRTSPRTCLNETAETTPKDVLRTLATGATDPHRTGTPHKAFPTQLEVSALYYYYYY